MDGVDRSLAKYLIDDYTSLRTVSWTATSDIEYSNKYDFDAHEFFNALGNADFYRGEQSSEAGKLHVPDHRDDMEAVGEDEEDEDNTVQAGFDDFSG